MTLFFVKKTNDTIIKYSAEKGKYERRQETRSYPYPTITISYLTKEEFLAELQKEQESHMRVVRELQCAINDVTRY